MFSDEDRNRPLLPPIGSNPNKEKESEEKKKKQEKGSNQSLASNAQKPPSANKDGRSRNASISEEKALKKHRPASAG